jgi:hypothetical protein
MRLSYFLEIGAATGRKCSAFQPVFTSYKLLEIERDRQPGPGLRRTSQSEQLRYARRRENSLEQGQEAQQRSPTIRDRYEAAMADETVDPLTRSLLRWFADVEADSGARLRAIYDRIEAQAG